MTNDLIADLITRIRNATLAQNSQVLVSYNKQILAFVKIFFKEGLIKSYKLIFHKNIKNIIINLRYTGRWIRKPLYSVLFKVSKPGQRIYIKRNKYKNNLFIFKYINSLFFISTSSGIMTHIQALEYQKGGEIICCIYKN